MTAHSNATKVTDNALPELTYLHEIVGTGTVPVYEVQHVPFSVSNLKIVPEDNMLLECVEDRWYLRSLLESVRIIPVHRKNLYLDQHHFDQVGQRIDSPWRLTCLFAMIFDSEFLVAWQIGARKPPVTFLPATRFEGRFTDLPLELQLAYRRADLDSPGFISKAYVNHALLIMNGAPTKAVFNSALFLEEEIAQVKMKALDSELINTSTNTPAGPWEFGIDQDIFGGDPNLMTDEEFEMVYGHQR
jgi:hypothetical protein